jgi:uncharacterized cupin superfamily protein
MEKANVFAAEFEYDPTDPDPYRCGAARVGQLAGGKDNIVKTYEMPAGETLCPYHYEYVEEWLLVLEGEILVRHPEGEQTLGRGDLICFPAGPAGAHKLINRSDSHALAMMFSSSREPSVAVYPDSGKVGVWTGEDADKFMFNRSDAAVEYYDGET